MSRPALKLGLAKFLNPLKPYNEGQLSRMFKHLVQLVRGVWRGDMTYLKEGFDKAFERAVADLNLEKSAGFPWYFKFKDKSDVLSDESALALLKNLVWRCLKGEKIPMLFSATLKDELRTRDRVLAHKTRVFNASDIVHLVCSKILFGGQNQALIDGRSKLPFTIGVSMPGPEFVARVMSLERGCQEGDIGGCDANFNLGVARVIREVRKQTIPEEWHDCADHLYDSVYCGFTVTEGSILELLHNKSGWENTSSDTGLMVDASLFEATVSLYPEVDYDTQVRRLINGDDLATGTDIAEWNLVPISEYLAQYGTNLEVKSGDKLGPEDITFLSNNLRWRYVQGFGDVLVAAGNREKLISSVQWVKTTESLTFEESVVAHLVGLRLCLWPFYFDFVDVDEKLDGFLDDLKRRGQWTSKLDELLKGRLSEMEILVMHTRFESGFLFYPELDFQCRDPSKAQRPIIVDPCQMSSKNGTKQPKSRALGANISKEEARARAEQSRRDKTAASRTNHVKLGGGFAKATDKLNRTGLNKIEHDLLEAIVDPSQNECRYPGVGDEPNVPFAFGPTYDIDFSGAGVAGDDVDGDEMVIIKRCDSLLLDSIVWQQTVSTASVYQAVFRTVDNTTGAASLGTSSQFKLLAYQQLRVDPLYMTHVSGDELHGDEQYVGQDTDLKKWLLISKGTTLSATFTADGNAGKAAVMARDGKGREFMMNAWSIAASTNTVITFPAPFTGYYRVIAWMDTAIAATWTVSTFQTSAPTNHGAWRQLSVQDIASQFDEVESFRVVGGSILCTQASSVTNMNGRGLQLQIPSGRDVLVAMRKSFTDYAQSNSKTFKPRDLYNGLYSYKKPADKVVDFRLRDEWEVDANGQLQEAAYQIVADTPMLVFYLHVPVAAGRVFTFQPGSSVNCSSDSAWKDIDEADGDDACVDRVLFILKGAPQHMENETHEKAIGQLADLALLASPYMGAYGPAVGAGAAVLKGLFAGGAPKRKTQQTMKAIPR